MQNQKYEFGDRFITRNGKKAVITRVTNNTVHYVVDDYWGILDCCANINDGHRFSYPDENDLISKCNDKWEVINK